MLLTIGLEIHMKLKTINKMFCQCKNEQNFDDLQANTHICPVCTGQPGALPTLSKEVLDKALLLGKALKCTINTTSQFDRKSYFYPDLPMGYQITQLYHPTCTEGQVSFFVDASYEQERLVHILEAHMECDTAKMIHLGGQTLLDFNRAGTPLVEIVTKPDFTTMDEVVEFLKELQRIVRYNDIADADLEKGQMRADVNISLRKNEQDPLGVRIEMKNMNSFGAIKRAIQHEYDRQKALYEQGESFTQQTRGRDDMKGESYLMRSKEDALDYRYFPEPDLPLLALDDETLKRVNDQTVVLPYDIIKKFKQDYGFNKEYINALILDKTSLEYFEALVNKGFEPKLVAKRIAGPINAFMKERNIAIDLLPFSPAQFESFLKLDILDSQLKMVMDDMLATGDDPEKIVKEKGFDASAVDENELEEICKAILEENATQVDQYKNGKTTVMGFFVGQVMKKTGGKAKPQTLQTILERLL